MIISDYITMSFSADCFFIKIYEVCFYKFSKRLLSEFVDFFGRSRHFSIMVNDMS